MSGRFLYRTRLEERHWHVLEQDRLAMERMAADADAREHLYSHDLGLTRVRGLLAREALQQAKALAARQDAAVQTESKDSAQPAGPGRARGEGREKWRHRSGSSR